MNKIIIGAIVLVLIGVGAYVFTQRSGDTVVIENKDNTPVTTTKVASTTPKVEVPPPTEETKKDEKETVIGTSIEKRPIVAYHYGTGDTELLFVGGIHGGYEWNTTLVAYELMNYLEKNPGAVPANVKVTVIPVLNPDGLNKVVGTTTGNFALKDVATSPEIAVSGRFNANNVDLNRNFDCDWKSSGTWQNKTVSGGSAVFSEPESKALRDYVESHNIAGAVVWYSAAGGVYASNCHTGVLPETQTITDTYAKASGYPANESFDFYEITGDAVNWLAKNNIPAISVLLTTHNDTEWSKNKAGIDALLTYYTK